RRTGVLAGRAPSPGGRPRRTGALAGRASSRRTGGRALPCTRWGFAPDPEMLSHLHLACGRDGGSASRFRSFQDALPV
ncbi:hypothetical protein D7X33_15855, partial [Butyricicoccus sp. 1XD8-22]